MNIFQDFTSVSECFQEMKAYGQRKIHFTSYMAQRGESDGMRGMLNKKNLHNYTNISLWSRRVLGETLILDCRETTVNTNFYRSFRWCCKYVMDVHPGGTTDFVLASKSCLWVTGGYTLVFGPWLPIVKAWSYILQLNEGWIKRLI